MDIYIVVPLMAAAIMMLGATVQFQYEKRIWNSGFCESCGGAWKHFDFDSQGGRGYKCQNKRYVWISWPVDK